MLDFYLAPSLKEVDMQQSVRASIGGANYWFLQRYFFQSCLEFGNFDFLNQFEDTEISGYQLDRLLAELKEAAIDLQARPNQFKVFTGWNGSTKSLNSEDWKEVSREEICEIVNNLQSLIIEAKNSNLCVVAIGD